MFLLGTTGKLWSMISLKVHYLGKEMNEGKKDKRIIYMCIEIEKKYN